MKRDHPEGRNARTGRVELLTRVTPPLLLTCLGLGILVSEFVAVLGSFLDMPAGLREFAGRYMHGTPALLLVGVVIAPVIEEFIFRGVLLRGFLAIHGPVTAVLLSAAIFAAIHMNLFQAVPALTTGILFGWVYVETRYLPLTILAHAFWNVQWWLPFAVRQGPIRGFGGVPAGAGLPNQPVWWLLFGVGAAVLGMVLLRRSLRPPSRVAPGQSTG